MLTQVSFDNQMVTLVAGPDKREFQTHRAHLGNSSAYFRAAFKEQWQEGQDRKITLVDADPDHLHRYLHFLYTGQIACQAGDHSPPTAHAEGSVAARVPQKEEAASDSSSSDSAASDPSSFSVNLDYFADSDDQPSTDKAGSGEAIVSEGSSARINTEEFELLAKLYVFGERFQDGRFEDAVVDAIVAKVNDADVTGYVYYPDIAEVNIIYEGTLKACPARQLMVNIYSTRGSSQWISDDANTEFLLDLTRSFTSLNERHQSFVDLLVRDSCDYHEHVADAPCRRGEAVKRKRELDDQ
ncbi:hypothetical protein LTR85_010687 [Meristemomyces frigidus]|nr:hypothetical protein LTR85_010687 [Meristemomyces frigidus]